MFNQRVFIFIALFLLASVGGSPRVFSASYTPLDADLDGWSDQTEVYMGTDKLDKFNFPSLIDIDTDGLPGSV